MKAKRLLNIFTEKHLNKSTNNFSGSPVIGTPDFQCRGYGFNPWQGIKDLACHAVWPKKVLKKNRKILNNKIVNVKITG